MPTLLEKMEANAALRLALPVNRLPAQELARYKNFLKVETHRLKILHRAGAAGREVCKARSYIIDLLLRYIVQGILDNAPEFKVKAPPLFSLVAIGGYGRAELNPFSDLDIMFLCDKGAITAGKAEPGVAALVDGVLYTLWDIGLKVGHAVRSVDDCVQVANGDMQSKTSLIEARRLTGDEKLFDQFQRAVLNKCIIGHEDEYIAARLQDQASRREKYGNSAFMQEPNIKNGCGGLRDYQNLVWMTCFKYRTRSLAELQQKEMISESERKRLEVAYDFLLRTRNELHYNVGRTTDVLPKSAQASIAYYMGYPDRSPSIRVEQFMGEFYTHTRNIDLITRTLEQRLALVPRATLIPDFRSIIRTQTERMRTQVVDGFKFLDGEIYPTSKNVFRDSPKRLMRVFLYAQQRGLKLHPDLAQLIRNQLSLVNNAFLRDSHVRETFLEILNQRGDVARIMRAMHEVGFLGKFIPEFGKLTCLVQHEFYHQYTADEHTLVCLEKLDQVWDSKNPPYSSYTTLFQQVERPFILYLALLLHDSGKAFRGKHEDIGGKNALRVAARLGLDGAKTHALRLIIENHLALVQISQRRDLDDPGVIRAFAHQVQSVEILGMLTLHTFADSMATSATLWNGFKEAALWTLYRKTYALLSSGGTEFQVAEARERELLIDEVKRTMPPTFTEEELSAHIANLPPRYLLINDAREILRDLTQVHRFIQNQVSDKEENALLPIFSWHNEPDRGYTGCNICTWDRERLFSAITGSFTAAGFNILGAEILTRQDGVVLDTFYVTDARTGLLANREEREKFEALLGKILTGGTVDLQQLISKQKRAPSVYKPIESERIPISITLDSVNSDRTIIDIESEDRVGLLYDISRVLTELDLDVSLAKITTEKGAAMDTFYVTEQDGSKILGPERAQAIERHLHEAILQGQS